MEFSSHDDRNRYGLVFWLRFRFMFRFSTQQQAGFIVPLSQLLDQPRYASMDLFNRRRFSSVTLNLRYRILCRWFLSLISASTFLLLVTSHVLVITHFPLYPVVALPLGFPFLVMTARCLSFIVSVMGHLLCSVRFNEVLFARKQFLYHVLRLVLLNVYRASPP